MDDENDANVKADETMSEWDQAASGTEQFAPGTRQMDALPPAEREALLLWNGGMDYREIAERTRQSLEDVGVHLAKARGRLAADE
jgi:DNA-directed RNA polymerase specialized sigma24 family protein